MSTVPYDPPLSPQLADATRRAGYPYDLNPGQDVGYVRPPGPVPSSGLGPHDPTAGTYVDAQPGVSPDRRPALNDLAELQQMLRRMAGVYGPAMLAPAVQLADTASDEVAELRAALERARQRTGQAQRQVDMLVAGSVERTARLDEVTAERDRARSIAVTLEGRLEHEQRTSAGLSAALDLLQARYASTVSRLTGTTAAERARRIAATDRACETAAHNAYSAPLPPDPELTLDTAEASA